MRQACKELKLLGKEACVCPMETVWRACGLRTVSRRVQKARLYRQGQLACACRHLRDHARTIPGKAQQFMIAFAKALEVIPRQLCDNAGFDATDVLNKLRQKHALKDGSGKNFGVDVNTGERWLRPAP